VHLGRMNNFVKHPQQLLPLPARCLTVLSLSAILPAFMASFRPGSDLEKPFPLGAFMWREITKMREFGLRPVLSLGLLTAIFAVACVSSNVLGVNYLLPARPAAPIGRSVVITFEDARKDSALLSPSAQAELEGFTNVYALTVSRPGRSGELKGAYTLGPLFMEILRYRLEEAGLRVLPSGAAADAQFKFVLKEFRMDFGDRKWSAAVAYESRLLKNEALLSQQTVNGSAERVMWMKKADAEKVIGELVSDAVNQMDLASLFKQAGL